jgi:hypothetical protein
MIQINAAVRLPLKMAHGTTFQNRSGAFAIIVFSLAVIAFVLFSILATS